MATRFGRPLAARLVALMLACGLATSSPRVVQAEPPSSASAKEQAKKLFDEGMALERAGDYARALAAYDAAETHATTPGLRFHKSYCLEMMGRLTAALAGYEAADRMAAEQRKDDVRAAVAARLVPLRTRLPALVVRMTTPVKDATLEIDSTAHGSAPLDGTPIRVDPGDRTVVVRAPGHRSFSKIVRAVEGATLQVDVALDRAESAAGAAVTPPPTKPNGTEKARTSADGNGSSAPASPGDNAISTPERRGGRSLALPITSTVATAVFAAGGLAFFLAADATHRDAIRQCPAKQTCGGEQTRVRVFDALALGTWIGAAGLGVLSVVLWMGHANQGTTAARAGSPHARLVATPGSFALEGTF